jgi:hypothetical protein
MHLYGALSGHVTGVGHDAPPPDVQEPSGHGVAVEYVASSGGGGQSLNVAAHVASRQRTGVSVGQTASNGQLVIEEEHTKPAETCGHAICPLEHVYGAVVLPQLKRHDPS